VVKSVRYALILFAGVTGVLGWIRPDPTPVWLRVVATVVIGLAAIGQVLVAIDDQRAKAQSQQSGALAGVKTVLAPAQLPTIEMGDSGAKLTWAGPAGEAMLKFFEDSHLTVVIEDRQMKVSVQIRDRKGNLVVELVKNDWKVSPASSFDRNFSADSLEVRDASGDIVFQVRVLSDRVQLQGKFYDRKGNGIAIGKASLPTGEVQGVLEMTGAAHPDLALKIQPLFKYPSSNHHGEYAK
jgi:hypothetical protein